MNKPANVCICTVVTQKALESVHDSGSERGSFRDQHPWFVAQELFAEAESRDEVLPLVFVTEQSLKVTDWALIEDIDVNTYAKHSYESRCSFYGLRPVRLIFEELSSLVLMPSKEQLHREAVEPIRVFRHHLDETHLRPYAVCETPPFVFSDLNVTPSADT